MGLFTETLIDEVLATVARQHRVLGSALGTQVVHGQATPQDLPGPLREQLRLLLQVANGELARSRVAPETEQRIEAALAALLDALTSNALGLHVPLTDAFWQTEVGVLTSRVRWWLSADDLITISNAAALAFGENTQATRMRIARAIDAGQLDWFPDPSVANPQHSRRVLRSQVERLRDLRQLPA
jgi:hypothetical protein